MSPTPEEWRRPDVRQSIRRDFGRYSRHPQGSHHFWRSLRVLGAIGWPIVLLAAGGAVVGHWLDTQWHSGVRWALLLVTCGTGLGCWVAWHLLGEGKR